MANIGRAASASSLGGRVGGSETLSHMIAIFGAGLLGSGFARALCAKGESVRVWNRSPDKALALAAIGAHPSADPAAAVRGAERTHIVVSAADAVDSVLAAAAPGLAPGALVIDDFDGRRARAHDSLA